MSPGLRRTPLFEHHARAGARLVPFAGWEMPVLYSSILAEHHAVRRSAGLFDVSHMGQIRLRGPDAVALAQRLFSNDVSGTHPGRVRYGLLCREDGRVIDDVTLYRVAADELLFCVNASNIAPDFAWFQRIREESGLDCELTDESDQTALLAIQGPRALAIAQRVVEDDEPPPRRWRFREARAAGARVWLSRTGYTGEDGYEIYAPAERASALWDALLAAGSGDLVPAGLGARDTLRTEMAYPLYGHELDLAHDPLEAGLERFLAFGCGFIGEETLTAIRERGPERRLVGVLVEGKAVPRPGYAICDGAQIGVLTSGTFGPSVERSIAIGYVPAAYAEPGKTVHVDVRGRAIPGRIVPTPFYDPKHRKS